MPSTNAADDHNADLTEPVDQKRHQEGVDQPADGEKADDRFRQREAQPETQMQVGTDVGKDRVKQSSLR